MSVSLGTGVVTSAIGVYAFVAVALSGPNDGNDFADDFARYYTGGLSVRDKSRSDEIEECRNRNGNRHAPARGLVGTSRSMKLLRIVGRLFCKRLSANRI